MRFVRNWIKFAFSQNKWEYRKTNIDQISIEERLKEMVVHPPREKADNHFEYERRGEVDETFSWARSLIVAWKGITALAGIGSSNERSMKEGKESTHEQSNTRIPRC